MIPNPLKSIITIAQLKESREHFSALKLLVKQELEYHFKITGTYSRNQNYH